MEGLRLIAFLAVLGHVHASAAGRAVLQASTAPPPPYEGGMFSPPPACPDPLPDVFLEPCDPNCGCFGFFEYEDVTIPLECLRQEDDYECVCFPAAATIDVWSPTLHKTERRTMSTLRVGDIVQVALDDGSLAYSAVNNIPHSELHGLHYYVQLRTASATLTLSDEHYTYVAPNTTAPFSARVAIPGRDVQVGDLLWIAPPGGTRLIIEAVLRVERVLAEGMYNPYTDQGTIVVDGVAASVYIDFLGGETAAHRSAAKYRLAARFAPRLVRWLHDRGLNQPLLLFMAKALPEMARRAQSGSPLLRPVWRAALWSLTEFPALLESTLPLAPASSSPLAANLPTQLPHPHSKTFEKAASSLLSAAAQIAVSNATTCPAVACPRYRGFNGRDHASTTLGAAVHSRMEL